MQGKSSLKGCGNCGPKEELGGVLGAVACLGMGGLRGTGSLCSGMRCCGQVEGMPFGDEGWWGEMRRQKDLGRGERCWGWRGLKEVRALLFRGERVLLWRLALGSCSMTEG